MFFKHQMIVDNHQLNIFGFLLHITRMSTKLPFTSFWFWLQNKFWWSDVYLLKFGWKIIQGKFKQSGLVNRMKMEVLLGGVIFFRFNEIGVVPIIEHPMKPMACRQCNKGGGVSSDVALVVAVFSSFNFHCLPSMFNMSLYVFRGQQIVV